MDSPKIPPSGTEVEAVVAASEEHDRPAMTVRGKLLVRPVAAFGGYTQYWVGKWQVEPNSIRAIET